MKLFSLQDDLNNRLAALEMLDESDLFVDQEWFDDDFGLGHRQIPNKPPPPYPGTGTGTGTGTQGQPQQLQQGSGETLWTGLRNLVPKIGKCTIYGMSYFFSMETTIN